MIVKCNLRDVIYVTIVSYFYVVWFVFYNRFVISQGYKTGAKHPAEEIGHFKLTTQIHKYGAKLVLYVTLVVEMHVVRKDTGDQSVGRFE